MSEYIGERLIHEAIRLQNVATVAASISQDAASVNEKDRSGDTPLHLACGYGSLEIAAILLEHGADTEATNDSGFKPIHEAAQGGHLPILQLLVEAGVDIDSQTSDGSTSLLLVSRPDQSSSGAAIFGWLLAHGAEYDLYTAVAYGMAHVVRAMITANPTGWLRYPHANEAIIKACNLFYLTSNYSLKKKRRLITHDLLEHDANPNVISSGTSPLISAISTNDMQIVELLIRHKANVNLTVENTSPLQMAKRVGNVEMIQLLLRHGVNNDDCCASG